MPWLDLSLVLRERVVAALEVGASCRVVASRFGVSVSTVVHWGQRQRETGSPAPGKYGGHKRHRLEPHRDLVHRLIAERPDRPVRELREELVAHGIELNPESIRRFLRAEGLSFTKKRLRHGAGQA
jgi:transposase